MNDKDEEKKKKEFVKTDLLASIELFYNKHIMIVMKTTVKREEICKVQNTDLIGYKIILKAFIILKDFNFTLVCPYEF